MIYFDMDDVIVDFHEYVNRVLGTKLKIGDMMTQENWAELRHNHPRMFRDMVPMTGMDVIVRKITRRGYRAALLTAIPFDGLHPWQHAISDKYSWAQKHSLLTDVFYGPYAHDKWKHCKTGDILVDDKKSNCDEWVAAGGIAHLFRGVQECETWFNETGILI
jgi:hypothetical protein